MIFERTFIANQAAMALTNRGWNGFYTFFEIIYSVYCTFPNQILFVKLFWIVWRFTVLHTLCVWKFVDNIYRFLYGFCADLSKNCGGISHNFFHSNSPHNKIHTNDTYIVHTTIKKIVPHFMYGSMKHNSIFNRSGSLFDALLCVVIFISLSLFSLLRPLVSVTRFEHEFIQKRRRKTTCFLLYCIYIWFVVSSIVRDMHNLIENIYYNVNSTHCRCKIETSNAEEKEDEERKKS